MKNIKTIALLLAAALMAPAANAEKGRDKELTYVMPQPYDVPVIVSPKGDKVKNVILMIGDGMSLAHIASAWSANHGKLYLENAPVVGLSKTWCLDKLITDSGAGGTALASGKKTNYHCVGVDGEGKAAKSLVEYARDNGLGSGIAVTCRLWDATPGDFCCHIYNRDDEDDVMADYVNCKADVVVGPGWSKMIGRKDGRNLFKELEAKGYQTPRSLDELDAISTGKVFCVTDSFDTKLPAERGDYLARAALKAIDILHRNNPNGFFLMVEGSQLDDYGHFNDLAMLMEETHDFDRTIGAIYEWAAKDGETLVVVTADHETGGLTLVDGDKEEGRIVCKFSTGGHSGTMVPVYAFGPGAENFTGIYENTEVANRIMQLLNLK